MKDIGMQLKLFPAMLEVGGDILWYYLQES